MVNPILQVIREMFTATEITENPWQGMGSSFGPNPLGFTFPSSPLNTELFQPVANGCLQSGNKNVLVGWSAST